MKNPNLQGSIPISEKERSELLPAAAKGQVKTLAQAAALFAFRDMRFGYKEWIAEVQAVCRLATADSQFSTALEGYSMLGKVLGIEALVDKPAQHNHLHTGETTVVNNDPKEMSTEELKEQIARLKAKKAQAKQIEAEPVEEDILADLM